MAERTNGRDSTGQFSVALARLQECVVFPVCSATMLQCQNSSVVLACTVNADAHQVMSVSVFWISGGCRESAEVKRQLTANCQLEWTAIRFIGYLRRPYRTTWFDWFSRATFGSSCRPSGRLLVSRSVPFGQGRFVATDFRTIEIK